MVRPACSPFVQPVTEITGRRISVSCSRGGRSRPLDLLLLPRAHLRSRGANRDRMVADRVTLDETAPDVSSVPFLLFPPHCSTLLRPSFHYHLIINKLTNTIVFRNS